MKTLKNVGKRVVALVLALMMCVGMLATTAFAEDVPEVNESEESTQAEVKEPETTEDEVTIEDVQAPLAAKTLANDKCDHDWVFDHCAYTVQPVCTVAHSDVFKCSKCPATKTVHGRLHDHTYEWTNALDAGNWDTFHGQKCTRCGWEINIGLHDWQDATCVDPATCPTCGATKGKNNPNNHSFTEFVSTTATCGAAGKDTYKCANCDATEERDAAATGAHSYSVFVSTTATCGAAGTATYKCANCSATEERPDAATGSHSFTNYVSNSDATCTKDGTETAKCDYCDATDTREIANSKLPHVYEGATCQNKGVCKCGAEGETNPNVHSGEAKTDWNDSEHWQIFANCNHEIPDTRFAHDFTWAKDGDTYTGTCSCGYVKTGVRLPEHVCVFDGDWVVGNGYHWHNCTVYPGDCPGVKDKDQHSTTQGWVDNSDGTHKKVCDICGATYETADHNWNAWVKVEDGYQRTCADCGAVDTDTSNVTVNDGHNHTVYAIDVAAVAATCTETGLTAGVKCDLCGKWIDEPTVTNALNHDFGDWYTVTAAQVGVAGLERHDCRREGCGASETRRIDPLPDTGTGDVVIDDTNPPLGGDPDGGDGEVELDDIGVPLAGPVTRGEFVDYLYRREGSPEAALSTFVDVPADHEYASAIGWGQVNDIAWGISETEFAPDELVTVEQVKLFLSRYAAFKGIEMPELAALVGLDDQDPAMNCDEILGEFFGADE